MMPKELLFFAFTFALFVFVSIVAIKQDAKEDFKNYTNKSNAYEKMKSEMQCEHLAGVEVCHYPEDDKKLYLIF